MTGETEKTTITVRKDWTGSRLDRFVRSERPALSFPVVQTLIRKGRIRLNGEKAPGKARLKEGDILVVIGSVDQISRLRHLAGYEPGEIIVTDDTPFQQKAP